MSCWGKSRFVTYLTRDPVNYAHYRLSDQLTRPPPQWCFCGLFWIFPRSSDPGRNLYYNYQKPLRIWRHNENSLLHVIHFPLSYLETFTDWYSSFIFVHNNPLLSIQNVYIHFFLKLKKNRFYTVFFYFNAVILVTIQDTCTLFLQIFTHT